MRLQSAEIVDTFAEAFEMWVSRVIVTAATIEWARAAAQSMTGFATSVIRCKCEAAVERELEPDETPDRRPGVSVLLFTITEDGMAARLIERVGQCVMTCPTTACYNGLKTQRSVIVGGRLRYFGDGWQISKVLGGRRLWRVPVMEGEFLVDDRFGVQPAVGGGNLLILGAYSETALDAAAAAATVMRQVRGVILPFPQGVVRCGSKIGSQYKGLIASTSHTYCPTLRAVASDTQLGDQINSVFEIVVDGVDLHAVEEAMRRGIHVAAEHGALQISAGNYGGSLGKYHVHLHGLLNGQAPDSDMPGPVATPPGPPAPS
ncbi:MAG: formylmethanofuran--tetrahydromethanopterin N-formyltransferase [Gammaproteobacteria bacterium]|nr:formylmethanofuran--tetrahydromethanopterin N-formyltransferase [Gammaproteobacteria bacterium]MBA3731887.1 formylmethanofuran--tetrahydromethanopterin N-formyltransferase [Gammaproteobacteria bacterium]